MNHKLVEILETVARLRATVSIELFESQSEIADFEDFVAQNIEKIDHLTAQRILQS